MLASRRFLRPDRLLQFLSQSRSQFLSQSRSQTIHWLLAQTLRHRQATPQPTARSGFTLLELLVVLLMVTILMAISAPVWLSMVDGQRLGAAQDDAFRALRSAQSKARQQRRPWEACFRTNPEDKRAIQYSVHPAVGAKCSKAVWRPLGAEASTYAAIDGGKSDFTRDGGSYVVQFNGRGWLASSQDGTEFSSNDNAGKRITFQMAGRPDLTDRSCVYVETLLGSLRAGRNDRCVSSPTP